MTPEPGHRTEEVTHDRAQLSVELTVSGEVGQAGLAGHVEVRELSQDILVFR